MMITSIHLKIKSTYYVFMYQTIHQ